MRRKLQDLIRGKIELEQQAIIFPEREVRFSVIENDVFQGRFSFASGKETPVRGIISCPNPHITCMTRKFDGMKTNVLFEYRAEGISEGSEEQGYFVITSSEGEFLYPFRAFIRKNYTHTSIGWIKTLNDFTNLAKLSWQEALGLFSSSAFLQVFHRGEESEYALYQGLTSRGTSSVQLEEFLVGIGKKKQNRFFVTEDRQTFVTSKNPISDSVHIEKSDWGYIQMRASCDQPFVQLEKEHITGSDFIGKHTELGYTILPERMHAGRNYARITIENVDQSVDIELIAVSEQYYNKRPPERSRDLALLQLEQMLVDYRLGRVGQKAWQKESLKVLENYMQSHPQERWFGLFAAYIHYICKEPDAAEHILKEIGPTNDLKKTPFEGFLRYLSVFRSSNPDYVKDVTENVRELYKKYPLHPVLAFVLLSIDEALIRNEERRYAFLKHFMTGGCTSPVFYLEVYRLILTRPSLLRKTDPFEKRVLCWLAKQDLLFPDLSSFLIRMSVGDSGFHRDIFRVLKKAWADFPSEELLKAICSYLVSNHVYDRQYYEWYALGIEKQIKLAGLYEAFLRVWDPKENPLPMEVVRYFMMQDSIQWKWKSRIYAWMIANRAQFENDWEDYAIKIRSFAMTALKTGYMSEELIDIYAYIRESVPAEEWDQIRSEYSNMYKVTVENERITHLCVLEQKRGQFVTIPMHEQTAFIKLPRQSSLLLMQDAYGNVFIPREDMTITAMLPASDVEELSAQEIAETALKEKPEQTLDQVIEKLEQFDDSLDVLDTFVLKAREAGVHVILYEEKMLVRMLFSGKFSESHEIFFRDVCESDENLQLCDAYVSRFSLEYLIDQKTMGETAIEYIRRSFLTGRRLNDYCAAALIKYQYTTLSEPPLNPITAEQKLRNMVLKNHIYGFYNQLPEMIKNRYLLNGKLFIQYYGVEHAHYELRYSIRIASDEGTKATSKLYVANNLTMQEALPGIYGIGIPVIPGAVYDYRILDAQEHMLEAQQMKIEADDTISDPFTRFSKLASLLSADVVEPEAYKDYRNETELVKELFLPMRDPYEWQSK